MSRNRPQRDRGAERRTHDVGLPDLQVVYQGNQVFGVIRVMVLIEFRAIAPAVPNLGQAQGGFQSARLPARGCSVRRVRA